MSFCSEQRELLGLRALDDRQAACIRGEPAAAKHAAVVPPMAVPAAVRSEQRRLWQV